MRADALRERRKAAVQGFRAHRRRLELEAAVEAAPALLDAMYADPDLEEEPDREPSEDPEPDLDGDGTLNRAWTIAGRDMWAVHGCEADVLLDPDETAGPGEPRAEWGMAG